MWEQINVLFVDDEQRILNAMRRTFRTKPWCHTKPMTTPSLVAGKMIASMQLLLMAFAIAFVTYLLFTAWITPSTSAVVASALKEGYLGHKELVSMLVRYGFGIFVLAWFVWSGGWAVVALTGGGSFLLYLLTEPIAGILCQFNRR